MRSLLFGFLVFFVSVCYGYPENYPFPHHPYYVFNYPVDPHAPLQCHQAHRSGHYFSRVNGYYLPDYRYPQFYMTQKYRPWYNFPGSRNQYAGRGIGFYRCYNKEGLSVECYDRNTR